MNTLTVIEKDSQTILKDGRKIYATITLNKNPDYNWMLWLKNSIALSGFKTKEDAINRANDMLLEWNNVLQQFK